MISRYTLIWVVFISFSAFSFTGCISVETVTIGKVRDLNMNDFTKDGVSVSCKVQVKNPNNFKIKVTKVKLIASLENEEIGKVKKINKIIVPANSNQVYDIRATVSLSEKYNNLLDLAQLSMKRSSLKVNGYIKVRSFLIGKKIRVDDKNIMKLLNN